MKRLRTSILVLIVLLVATACGGESAGNEPAVPPASSPAAPARARAGAGTYFEIPEIGLGPEGFVALTNYTDVPASLAGLRLCQGAECIALPDVVVAPDETVRIAAGSGAGLEGVVATGATLGELRPSDGEIALFAPGEPDDPQAMAVYYQWGSTPHALTQRAIDTGLWVEGGYGPSSERATRLFKAADSGLWLFEEP